jgi:hypothetical protein
VRATSKVVRDFTARARCGSASATCCNWRSSKPPGTSVAQEKKTPCSGSNCPLPTAVSPRFSDAVSTPPKRTIRAAYSVMPASRNSSSNWNWSGSPVSSRRRNLGSPLRRK